MQVIAEQPWDWFLFEDDGKLFLDVLVENSAISFSIAAELSAEQAAGYACKGAACLTQLSGEMRYQALRREWIMQPLPPGWNDRSVAAVHEWRKRASNG